MSKKNDPYIIVTLNRKNTKQKMDTSSYHERKERKSLRDEKKNRQNLRVFGKKRRKTASEKDGDFSIYTGSFFELSSRTANRKPSTLEIIFLIDRIEIHKKSCSCLCVEEWNSRKNSRSLTKRYFYRNTEGNWMPGKSIGLNYLDLEHILKETKEGQKIRKRIMKFLDGPSEN